MLFDGKRHPLQSEAEQYANLIQDSLIRMGMAYIKEGTRKRRGVEQYVEFVSPLIAKPDRIEIEIDTRLPRGITIGRLCEKDVLDTLSARCKRTVRAEKRGKQGTWFVIELEERDKIPQRISYQKMSATYPTQSAALTIPIGYGEKGPRWEDLRKLPHLLIAGATGQGKSVAINAIVCTLLQRLPPEQLVFLMADLKGGIELSNYEGIPHMRAPLATRAGELPIILCALQSEMERRTELLRGKARDIDEYNKQVPSSARLPYIVAVIDEIANAMLSKQRIELPDGSKDTVKGATERLLADIAARARAEGIHLVVSTQRPSVDVVTGLIKANFPCRIAFGTSSDVDSRVIIDDSSAQGQQPGRMKFRRNIDLHTLQGPFIADKEISSIIKATKRGEYLKPPETPEDKARREIAMLLQIGMNEFDGHFVIKRLTVHNDVKSADIPGTAIDRYAQRLSDEGVIRSVWRRGTYKIMQPDAYKMADSTLSTDAVLHDTDAEFAGTTIEGNPVPVLVQKLLPIPPVPEDKRPVEQKIQAWASEGLSRNEMAKRLGGGRNEALAKIRAVLGPAKRKEAA
jgi:hypothetical protein